MSGLLGELTDALGCGFCGTPATGCWSLLRGPTAAICDACVSLAHITREAGSFPTEAPPREIAPRCSLCEAEGVGLLLYDGSTADDGSVHGLCGDCVVTCVEHTPVVLDAFYEPFRRTCTRVWPVVGERSWSADETYDALDLESISRDVATRVSPGSDGEARERVWRHAIAREVQRVLAAHDRALRWPEAQALGGRVLEKLTER